MVEVIGKKKDMGIRTRELVANGAKQIGDTDMKRYLFDRKLGNIVLIKGWKLRVQDQISAQ